MDRGHWTSWGRALRRAAEAELRPTSGRYTLRRHAGRQQEWTVPAVRRLPPRRCSHGRAQSADEVSDGHIKAGGAQAEPRRGASGPGVARLTAGGEMRLENACTPGLQVLFGLRGGWT